jgi:hypothetical protein
MRIIRSEREGKTLKNPLDAEPLTTVTKRFKAFNGTACG